MRNTLLLVGICALLVHTSCNSEKKEKEEEVKYVVTNPIKMDTSITKEYVCQIKSIRHIELRALERGYLERIYVDEGQMVHKGQLLFQIMPKLYNAEVQKSQAEANFAEIEYRNTKGLADSNIVSSNELAMGKAKLNKAKAELSLAQVHRQFTEVRAPFDGIINRLEVKLGSLVDEGDLLSSLSDNSQMWVYYNVPEAEYLNYKATTKDYAEKMKVSLMMANNQPFAYQGIVETIEADFNNETGNIAFRATFPNPDKLLRNGETGNIEMVVPMKNAILIPQKATYEVMDKKYVFVVDNNKVVKSREIVIGADLEDLYIITSGLSEGDKILLEGIRKVKENMKISYEYEDPQKVMNNLKVPAE